MVSINITQEDIDRLSALELITYATGNLPANPHDLNLIANLNSTPVKVRMIVERGVCDDELYRICEQAQGEHPSFSELRISVTDKLFQHFQRPGSILLSALYAGIYVGDPEDVLNHLNQSGNIMYPVKGLGQKIAEVGFVF